VELPKCFGIAGNLSARRFADIDCLSYRIGLDCYQAKCLYFASCTPGSPDAKSLQIIHPILVILSFKAMTNRLRAIFNQSGFFVHPAHSVFSLAASLPAILLLSGPVQAQFAGGSGTAEDPYQIETIQQLQKIGESTYRSSHFIQVADIDASDTKNWNDGQGFKPISFRGDYDGKDYVISDLYINRQDEDYVGLVSSLAGDARSGKTAKIRRLGLVNVDITGGNYVGGLAGYKLLARIETSFVTGRVTGQRQVGGLIGHFERSCDGSEPPPDKSPVILRSYSQVTVSGTEKVGGVAGSAAATFPTGIYYGCGGIHETYASGQVSGEDMVGGWAGIMADLRPQSANYWDISLNDDLEAIGYYFYTGSDPNIIEGLNTEQMTGQNAFIYMNKLDFEHIWQLTEGYPVLRWQDPADAVDPPFAGGSGTEPDPFQIETLEQLQLVDDLYEYHYLLVSDIDASETAGWNDGKGFKPARLTGSFDGGGHIISNLYINRPDEYHVGLFGFAERAKIVNTGLVDVEITGRESVGGIAGTSYLSDIHNSFVTGSVTASGRFAGGLVGEFIFFTPSHGYYGEAAVWNCYTDVSVSGDRLVGGLAGVAFWYRITPIDSDEYDHVIPEFAGIYESFSVGQVSGQSSTGGFIGGGYPEYIKSNYWDRESSGQNQWDGGEVDSQSATGLSTDQMTGQNAFIHMYELDFVNAWQLTEGYPVLRWQNQEDAVDPPEVPIIRMDTTKRDFGEVSIDSSVTVEVPIRNTGNNILNGEVYLAGPDAALFAIADGLSSFSLKVDSSQAVAITFYPVSFESYEAELHVVHDAPNRSDTLIIPLSGQGKEPTDATPAPDLPGELALHQNYPNPFNPSTVITYLVPSESRVQLTIYDVTGRRVSALVDEVQAPGEYRVMWDASEIASGIYIYRLSASGHTLTRRMTLIR
jgi:hypothetical protein